MDLHRGEKNLKLILFFYIYAFLGWCIEVIYKGLKDGKFVNSGMLLGPWCPIYGIGGLLMAQASQGTENIFLIFMKAMFIGTVVEFIVGLGLNLIFKQRWWDYRDMPFNIGGYICPLFSMAWGMVGVFLILFIQEPLSFLYEILSYWLILMMVILISIVFITDLILTLGSLLKINRHIRELEDIRVKIRGISDRIGEKVYKDSRAIAESQQGQKLKADMEKLKTDHEKRLAKTSYLEKRLLLVFKKSRSTKYSEAFDELRNRINLRNGKKD